MSIDEKLQQIKKNKITLEKIEALEKELERVSSYKRVTPTGDMELSPTDELLSLSIKVNLITLRDEYAENLKRDIEFSEQVIGLKEQAESLMKDMGKKFGGTGEGTGI